MTIDYRIRNIVIAAALAAAAVLLTVLYVSSSRQHDEKQQQSVTVYTTTRSYPLGTPGTKIAGNLEAVTVAAPVDDEIEPGIEDCRGIARMRSLSDTDRLGQPVRSVAYWLMATGTTDISVDRQSGIEEEQPAEIDSLRRNRRLRRRHVSR